MSHVTVVSSCYGAYDVIQPVPAQSIDARWLLVTDHEVDAPGWEVIIEPRPDVHPRLAAKVAKCLPWQYSKTEVNVWMDTSCHLLREDSLEEIIERSHGPISQILHPWRSCIYSEAEASQGMLKYQGRDVLGQVESYRHEHPEDWGLWCTGLIVTDATSSWSHREQLDEFGAHWLAEQMRFTYQDQLSEPVVLRRFGLRPHELGFPLHGNGILEWHHHNHEG